VRLLSSFAFFVVAFLVSRRALSLMVCCASSFYISLSKGRNFFILMIIPEPRARAMMPRAARPSSNATYSRRRPQRRDIALFRRLALTPKAFFKTEDKRARLERRI
jgi:flagellar biosynthesis protein FliP